MAAVAAGGLVGKGRDISLAALQRHDPYINRIVDVASQVALYTFGHRANEWVRADAPGPCRRARVGTQVVGPGAPGPREAAGETLPPRRAGGGRRRTAAEGGGRSRGRWSPGRGPAGEGGRSGEPPALGESPKFRRRPVGRASVRGGPGGRGRGAGAPRPEGGRARKECGAARSREKPQPQPQRQPREAAAAAGRRGEPCCREAGARLGRRDGGRADSGRPSGVGVGLGLAKAGARSLPRARRAWGPGHFSKQKPGKQQWNEI